MAKTQRVRLIVNGKTKGNIAILYSPPPVGPIGIKPTTEITMVPIRPVMEAIDWKVSLERYPDMGVKDLDGALYVGAVSPYLVEYGGQDLELEFRGKKAHESFVIFLKTGKTEIYSPQVSMLDSLESNPLPQIVDGKLYVPLNLLEDVIAANLGKITGNSDHGAVTSHKGVKMIYLPKHKELQILYADSTTTN